MNSENLTDFFSNNTFPDYLIVDSKNEVIYWTNFISADTNYEVMKTYYNKTTTVVRRYPSAISEIKIAQGEKYLYVLNPTLSQVDKIDKKTESLLATFNVQPATTEIMVADGKLIIRTL